MMFCCCKEIEHQADIGGVGAPDFDTFVSLPSVPATSSSAAVPAFGEDDLKKANLTKLVHNFTRNATRGSPCIYLDEISNERCPTLYTIDKDLKHLIILSPKDDEGALVVCPLPSIEDVYAVDDGESSFPKILLEKLSPEEKEVMSMIVYRKGKDDNILLRLCLLSESRILRDEFLECMRVLNVYAKTLPKYEVATVMVKGAVRSV